VTYELVTYELVTPTMPINARFAHTNIVAKDWKRLADFYQRVFDCIPVPPERYHMGAWLDACTGLTDARLTGMHLRLPGYGEGGPTLEIFEYEPSVKGETPAANRPGFAHIAFAVDDVPAALAVVLTEGGGALGEIVSLEIAGAGHIELVYVTDPEGNIIELQHWS